MDSKFYFFLMSSCDLFLGSHLKTNFSKLILQDHKLKLDNHCFMI